MSGVRSTWSRRRVIGGMSAAIAAGSAMASSRSIFNLKALEHKYSLRIGAMVQTTDGRLVMAHRAHERFLFCSTFKAFLVGAVLERVQTHPELLHRQLLLRIERKVGNSPVTSASTASLSVEALCAATMSLSDNWAANLLLDLVGGPLAVTRFMRRLGDSRSRLDRDEPELNVGAAGDVRDTTTPASALGALSRLLLDERILASENRARILGWMENERNGIRRMRAGVPAGWTVANKPGTNNAGAVNDIALLRPPSGLPLLATIYLDAAVPDIPRCEVIIADIARMSVAQASRLAL